MRSSDDPTSPPRHRPLADLLAEIDRTPKGDVSAGLLGRWTDELREHLAAGETVPAAGETVPVPAHVVWEDDAAFRHVFLAQFEDADREALRRVGMMLHNWVLEATPIGYNPEPNGDPPVRAELRATAADLRNLWGFFRTIEVEGDEGPTGASGALLTTFAGTLAAEVERLALTIEREL